MNNKNNNSNNNKYSLVLQIHDSGSVNKKVVSEKEGFSIGQRPDNDLILFGQRYPKKHTLISKHNGYYQMFLPTNINSGELREGDSVLDLKDLILQDVLPRNRNNYVLKLSPKKEGHVLFGDTRIDFLFDRKKVVKRQTTVKKFAGFSWFNVTMKNLFSDLAFKLIVLTLFLFNATILYLFKDYEIKVSDTIDIEKVQQRFAKFIIKVPEEIPEINANDLNNALSENDQSQKNEDKDKANKQKSSRKKSGNRKKRGNPVASAGLLGLIGGTGSSNNASSVINALVDKGLVTDLKKMMSGGSNLKVGRSNTKDDVDPLDQLIGLGGSGGIDDFLEDIDDGVETVALKKQGRVNLAKAEQKSGDEEALGARTEQSVMNVVNTRKGRIGYFYEKYLKRQPNLRGKITIQFSIIANGFVKDVKILKSTVNHPELERDIVTLIKRLKFKPIPKGTANFVYPFVFQKVL